MAISSDAAVIAAAQLVTAHTLLSKPPADIVADRDKLQNWLLAQFDWYKQNIRPNAIHLDSE